MKKIIPLVVSLGALAVAALGGIKYNEVKAAFAYSATSASKLNKNLDLNDADEETIRNYYSDLNSLSDAERTGNNLLKNLKPILKKNQIYYAYDGTDTKKAIWQMYEIIDRDWDKSPASGIAGYNASTNTITGYKYGEGLDSKGSNPYIHALYVNRDIDNQTRAWDDHAANQQWSINQEHVWPKSCGFETEAKGGARGDPMHLWAGNGRVNSTEHSNYYYGYVDLTKTYTDPVKDKGWTNLSNNYMGVSKTLGGSVKVFEPQDSDKGDIARAIFYMVARYNYISGSDSDGIDANNPNLELTDSLSTWKEKGYQSTTTSTGKMGIVSDLLEWNKLDPVDEFEIHRNNLLFNNYTNNRNPFIDFPEWADYIWSEEKGSVSANPQSDVINDAEEQKIIVKIGDKTVTGSSIKATVNEAMTVSAKADPSTTVKWEIEDETVATVTKKVETPANSNLLPKQKSTAEVTEGELVTITPVKAGTTKLTIKATVDSVEETREIIIKVTEKSSGGDNPFANLDLKTIIVIAAIVLIVLFVAIILFAIFGSKKAKKKANKVVKKAVKSSIKKNTRKK